MKSITKGSGMLSVFTPSHHSKFLGQAYDSLLAQTDKDWEWTIVHNNGGVPLDTKDARVKQHVRARSSPWVGPQKAFACDVAKGDILLELDHDDMLAPTAVAEVKAAFADPEVGFVYSNNVRADLDWNKPPRFNDAHGWQYRPAEFNDHKLEEIVSFEATPEAVSLIWYAPDHLRAFRRSVYEEVGGYSLEMRVLDDQDLMCRLFQHTKFHHIDKPLYMYRVHGDNSWLVNNAEIQVNTVRLHDVYAEAMALAWAKRKGLRMLELGGRIASHPGYETVDVKGASINCDLQGDWPMADSSVGVIRAFDVFEHLRDPLHTMKECYRVLAPGGWIFAQVPSTDGRGAFQDPTHVSFWNENSWLYYTHANWARYIDTPVRFQAVRNYTTEKDARGVCWTRAHLICMKDGYRPPGIVEI